MTIVALAGRLHRSWPAIGLAATSCAMAMVFLESTDGRSIWIDEAFTKAVATSPSERLPDDIALNGGNMVLYLVLMRAWLLVDASDWWLRLPSIAAAVATIPTFYVLSRRFVARVPALVGSLAVAASPALAEYGLTARSYSLAVLLIVLGWIATLRCADDGSRVASVAIVALGVAAIYCQMLCALFVGSQLLWLHAGQRRIAAWCGAAITVLSVPQLLLATGPSAREPVWIASTNGKLVQDMAEFLTGTTSIVAAAAVAVVCAIGAYLLVRTDDGARHVPIAWVVLPLLALLGISVFQPMFIPRYLVMAVPGLVLMLCAVADRLRPLGYLLVAAVLAVNVHALPSAIDDDLPDWRAATALVMTRGTGDEAIFLHHSRQLVEHYWSELGAPATMPTPLSQPNKWGPIQRTYDFRAVRARETLRSVSGVWVVERVSPFPLTEDEYAVLDEIEEAFASVTRWTMGDGAIRITHYRRTSTQVEGTYVPMRHK